MKKVWKGFAAAVSAAAIAATGFIGATSASAADLTIAPGTITIDAGTNPDRPNDSAQFTGYMPFTILSGTQDGEDITYAYGVNATNGYTNAKIAAIINAANLDGDAEANDIVADPSNTQITDWLRTNLSGKAFNSTQAVEFGKAVVDYSKVAANRITPSFENQTAAQLSAADVTWPAGYYVLAQTGPASDENNTVSKYIAGNVEAASPLKITIKNGTVEAIKKVKEDDKDDSITNGTFGDKTLDKGYNDVADYEIGQDIPFEFRGSLPDNFASITPFKYIFHDTMSTGLTFNNDVKVYVNTVDNDHQINNPENNPFYTVPTKGITTGETFNVNFPDLHNVTYGTNSKINANDTIIIRYTGKLNNDAVIGNTGNTNNTNTMKLEFSNNPYDTDDTEVTPEDKVVIFTYNLGINKVDANDADKKLAGAEFKLYDGNGDNKKAAVIENGKFVQWVTETAATEDKPAVTGTTLTTVDGNIAIAGLDSGTYYLEETEAPAGYNKIEGLIEVVLQATTNNTQNWDGSNANSLVTNIGTVTTMPGASEGVTAGTTVTIANNKGSNLPSTGGMGTTVLYVAGAAIVLIAGIGLAVALRRRQA